MTIEGGVAVGRVAGTAIRRLVASKCARSGGGEIGALDIFPFIFYPSLLQASSMLLRWLALIPFFLYYTNPPSHFCSFDELRSMTEKGKRQRISLRGP